MKNRRRKNGKRKRHTVPFHCETAVQALKKPIYNKNTATKFYHSCRVLTLAERINARLNLFTGSVGYRLAEAEDFARSEATE